MTRFIILGSGPVGSIICHYLLNKNHKVTLIDNSEITRSNNNSKFTLKKVEKNVFSDFYINNKKGKQALPVGSKNKGGFSKVWGGTISELSEKDLDQWKLNYTKLIPYFDYIIENLNLKIKREDQKLISEFDNYDLIAENMFSLLLNQPTEEIFFEKSKLFINDKEEMWNSWDTITKLKKQFPKFEYISNFEVTKISQTGDVINIVSKIESLIFKNSKLIVATGPFPSSYLCSNLVNADSFKVQSSDLRVFPILWLGKKSKLESKKVFPQIFLNYRNELGNVSRGQIYILNKQIINSLGEDVATPVIYSLKLLNKLLKNRIALLFLYEHSFNSTSYEFQNLNEKINTIAVEKKKNISIFRLLTSFYKKVFRYKLAFIPVYKKFETYGSFHLGSTSFKIDGSYRQDFNKDGSLKDYPDIHFVDSILFQNVPSGPTTFLSMALGLNTTNKIINNL